MKMAANTFAADPGLCFAFLRGGDVVVSCEGQEFRVGETGKVNSFAIAEEQGVLAVVFSFLNVTPGAEGIASSVRMIDLRTAKVRYAANIPTVMSTCGGLFGVFDSNHQPTRKDLLTETEFQADPYTWFRCSADRKVLAGIAEPERALYQGSIRIAGAGSAAHYEFNISPNGKYVAYASDRQPLCVWSAAGTQCAPADMIDTSHDLVSVRDDGDILVTMSTPDKCVFESTTVYRPARPNDKKTWNCAGIGHWRAGMGPPEIVEAVGREPQWISPATASLLRAWARKSKAYF
jgi:hypothetical protein